MIEHAHSADSETKVFLTEGLVAEQRRVSIEKLTQHPDVSSSAVEALAAVPRHEFVPPDALAALAYQVDSPIQLGEGSSLSSMEVVAMMTSRLDAQPGDKVLEIGTGSGYQAAVLANQVGENGKVYTVEVNHRLVQLAEDNLRAYTNVQVIHADGSNGLGMHAPYNRIIYTVGARTIPHQLYNQLAVGGRLIMPVLAPDLALPPELRETEMYQLRVIENRGGQLVAPQSLNGGLVMFHPLRSEPHV